MRTLNKNHLLRTLSQACACLMLAATFASAADARSTTYQLDIPMQSLDGALQALALASQHKLLYDTVLVKGKHSTALKGEFTAEEAVRRLLSGTNLSYEVTEDGLVLIRLPSAPADSSSSRAADTKGSRWTNTSSPSSLQVEDAQSADEDERESPTPSAFEERRDESVQEIVVTGSHIVRRDSVSHSPVSSIGTETLGNLGQPLLIRALNTLPQISPAAGNTLNLRGLGAGRTLTLLDGRRLPTADISVLPAALIEDVEIITGGASAVYGSDAVAGVVNFVLKKNFSGLEISATRGAPTAGDTRDIQANLTMGGNFGESRGNAVLSFEYSDQEMLFVSDRDYTIGSFRQTNLPEGEVAFGANRPTQAAFDAVFGSYGVAAGTVPNLSNVSFNPDGTLYSNGFGVHNVRSWPATDFIKGTYLTIGNSRIYETRGYRSIVPSQTRQSLFGRLSYDVTDDVAAYGQVLVSRNKTISTLNPLLSRGSGLPVRISTNNPFIPADLRTLLNARPDANADFEYFITSDNIGGRPFEATTTTYQVIAGLKGKLPVKDWTWDVYGSYGKVNSLSDARNWFSVPAFDRVLRSADGGAAFCPGGYNPFGYQPLNETCRNFLARNFFIETDSTQSIAEAVGQGGLFDLPAGEVRFALGLNYREESTLTNPDAQIFPGRGEIPYISTSTFPISADDVSEAYLELAIPVLRDLPLIRSLEIGLGYRYSDYKYVGGVSAYKADGNWRIFDMLRLRGGYQHAVRAPSIVQLAAPLSSTFDNTFGTPPQGGDPCDIRSARRISGGATARALCLDQGVPGAIIDQYQTQAFTYPITIGGNPNLEAETADTYSIGMVLSSPFRSGLAKDLSLSVDYFNIPLDGAIGTISGPQVLGLCFNANGASNPSYSPENPFCRQITRGASGELTNIDVLALNLGGYKTSGIDTQFDWRMGLDQLGLSERAGSLVIKGIATHLLTYELQNRPGDPFLEYAGTIGNAQVAGGGVTKPKWRGLLMANYVVGPLNAGIAWRYAGKQQASSCVGIPSCITPGVSAVSYFDLNAAANFFKNVTLFANVNNVFDKQPVVFPLGSGSIDSSTYDVIGRRIAVGVTARF